MAAGTPLTRLTLGAASVADDLGYVALSDLARALGDVPADFRVIGGHMVTMLAARWQLGHELYRETGDVDSGIAPIVARDHHVVGRLKDLDYTQVAGNRFARGLSDVPVKMKDRQDSPRPQAFIDVLVPVYTSRARENVQVGDDLLATEVPGLQLALARPAVTITLELRRLKGLGPADFTRGVRAEPAEVIRSLFGSRRDAPVAALAAEQHLSAEATDARFTRIQALIARVLGRANTVIRGRSPLSAA